jgi:hypothetical protein
MFLHLNQVWCGFACSARISFVVMPTWSQHPTPGQLINARYPAVPISHPFMSSSSSSSSSTSSSSTPSLVWHVPIQRVYARAVDIVEGFKSMAQLEQQFSAAAQRDPTRLIIESADAERWVDRQLSQQWSAVGDRGGDECNDDGEWAQFSPSQNQVGMMSILPGTDQ